MKKIILACLLLTGITLLTACVEDGYYYNGNYDNNGNYWGKHHTNRNYSSSGSSPHNYRPTNSHYSSSGSVPQNEYVPHRGSTMMNSGYSSSGSISQ